MKLTVEIKRFSGQTAVRATIEDNDSFAPAVLLSAAREKEEAADAMRLAEILKRTVAEFYSAKEKLRADDLKRLSE